MSKPPVADAAAAAPKWNTKCFVCIFTNRLWWQHSFQHMYLTELGKITATILYTRHHRHTHTHCNTPTLNRVSCKNPFRCSVNEYRYI
jgi:hypothetical protein